MLEFLELAGLSLYVVLTFKVLRTKIAVNSRRGFTMTKYGKIRDESWAFISAIVVTYAVCKFF